MKRNIKCHLFAGALAVSLLCTAAFGQVVVTNTQNAGVGSLRVAVDNSMVGETITFNIPTTDPNCTGGVCTINLLSSLTVDNDLTINGTGAASLIIRRSAAAMTNFSIFTVDTGKEAVTFNLSNVTVSHGTGMSGGGIRNSQGGTVSISNAVFRNHAVTGGGGGIFNDNGGNLTISNSTFTDNVGGGSGGAIRNDNASTLNVSNSTFTNNSVNAPGGGSGGAINNDHESSLTLTNSTFNNNGGGNTGGALKNDNMSVMTVTKGTFTNNSVTGTGGSSGGAISTDNNSMLTILGSTFTGNSCGIGGTGGCGGAGINSTASTLNISNSIFNANQATGAGGTNGTIANSDGTLTMTNSTVSNNTAAGGAGAGVFNSGTTATATITGSTISGNVATNNGFGGGIYNGDDATATISNSTISGNSATEDGLGGGIINIYNSTLNLTNVTVTGNSATGLAQGGGIYNSNGGVVNPKNSIFSGNTCPFGADAFGNYASLGFNLIGTTAGSAGWIAGDLQNNANALLGPLGNNGGTTMTHALTTASAAINAGVAANAPATDQRGAARAGGVDIGAFESNPAFIAVLPRAIIGRPYSQTQVPNNGAFTYSLTGGSLPPGINLTTSFDPVAVIALAGTPTQTGTFDFQVTGAAGDNSHVNNFRLTVTNSTVSVSGQVLSMGGLGRAVLSLLGPDGQTRTARASGFGYYRFEGVELGATYILSVRHKALRFAPQTVTVNDTITDLNFTPLSPSASFEEQK